MRRRSRVVSSGTVIPANDSSTFLPTANGDSGSINSSGPISSTDSTNSNKSQRSHNNNNTKKTLRAKGSAGSPPQSQEQASFAEAAAPMADIPPQPPAVNLFARFQQQSSDFTADWLMMREEAIPAISPISLELSEKLRQCQVAMQKQRNDTGSRPGDKVAAVAITKASSESGKSDDDDDEYSVHDINSVDHTTHQSLDSDADDVVVVDNDGLHGDYLSLLPRNDSGDKIKESDLQVTVTLQEGIHLAGTSSETPLGSGMRNLRKSAQQEQQERGYRGENSVAHAASPMLQRVVPLWCVERFTTHNGYASNPLIALHQEICDFVKFLRPSQAEVTMRRLIEMEVGAIAKRLWPDCEPIVYGSMSTHLLLPLSDLDMTILNVPVPTEEALTVLGREISREGLCHAAYPQLILKTKVPLVKFQHRLSLLDVDISINAADGQRNTAIVVDMLQQFPEARPLIVVVKYFLQQRGMHEPYHGGLGSFATTLLVFSFLQQHPIYTSAPEERSYSGLGRLLVDFFRYYGMYFNYNRCGISLLDGGRYFQRTDTSMELGYGMQRLGMGPPQVLIEDPGCPQNNVASSLRIFHVIASVFTHAYMALTGVFNPPHDGDPNLSPDSTEIARRPTLLSRILHVDAPSVKRRQAIAAAYETVKRDIACEEKMMKVALYRREEDELIHQGRNPKTTSVTMTTTTTNTTTTTITTTTTKKTRAIIRTAKSEAVEFICAGGATAKERKRQRGEAATSSSSSSGSTSSSRSSSSGGDIRSQGGGLFK